MAAGLQACLAAISPGALYRFQISGGPDRLDRERFDITATFDEARLPKNALLVLRELLKALLADRAVNNLATLFVALEEQLGLELVSARGPVPDRHRTRRTAES